MMRTVALLFLLALWPVAADAAPTPLAATLRVTIDGVTASGGTLRVGLYDEATYPAIPDTALFKREIPKIAGSVVVTFDRLPPGTYAVKVLQDVNNNGKADPGEPKGTSNGANADDFDGAAIVLEPGVNSAAVHLR
ncbi:MAG TPA: DUF2141 domain-containing protein [Micropepsaceae bacterium]|nr:DUF2141 domain-containing protein [Micropepsaceae bacterium]